MRNKLLITVLMVSLMIVIATFTDTGFAVNAANAQPDQLALATQESTFATTVPATMSATTTADVTVPNLIGLSVPEAAQAAAKDGLLFSGETAQEWTASASVQPNQVSEQTPAADQKVARGTAITVTVLRTYNIRLIYTAQEVVILNLSKGQLDLADLTFENTTDPKVPVKFAAFDWGLTTLDTGACARLTTTFVPKVIGTVTPKAAVTPTATATPAATAVNPCAKPVRQTRVAQPSKLFWLANFSVLQGGISVGTCAAATGTCDVFVPQRDSSDWVPYLTFNYRENHLSIRNDSKQWVLLANLQANGNNGKKFLLDTTDNMTAGDFVWAGHRLAPGQCVVYSELDITALPPYDCDVVGYIKLPSGGNFWQRGFSVTNLSTNRRSQCNKPIPGLLSICTVLRQTSLKDFTKK